MQPDYLVNIMFISSHNMASMTANTFSHHFFISRAFNDGNNNLIVSLCILLFLGKIHSAQYKIRNDFCLDKFLTQGMIVSTSQVNIQDFLNSENLRVEYRVSFTTRKLGFPLFLCTGLFIALRFILIIAQKPLSTCSIKGRSLVGQTIQRPSALFSHISYCSPPKDMFSLISLPINLSGAIRACVVYQQLCFLHAMQDEDK